jgi:hypothetical protein
MAVFYTLLTRNIVVKILRMFCTYYTQFIELQHSDLVHKKMTFLFILRCQYNRNYFDQ